MNDSIVREVQWSDVNTKNMWVRNGRFTRSYLVVYDAIETISSLCSTNKPAKAKALQSIRHHLDGKMNIRTCFFHHWSVWRVNGKEQLSSCVHEQHGTYFTYKRVMISIPKRPSLLSSSNTQRRENTLRTTVRENTLVVNSVASAKTPLHSDTLLTS